MDEGPTLDLFIGAFSAHADAYVEDSRRHIEAPLTRDVLVTAMRTRHAISGYMARAGANGHETHIGAVDFDHAEEGAPEQVRATLAGMDVPTLLVQSRRGAHLWVQSSDMIPAYKMRRFLEHAVKLTGDIEGYEVFPKRSDSPYGVGALRMPLMRHPKTGLRYPVIGMDGREATTIREVLLAFEDTPHQIIDRIVGGLPVEKDYPRGLGAYRRQTTVRPEASATDILATLGIEATPGHSCICPYHDDHRKSMSVARDDQRVWCKSPECVAYNDGRGLGSLMMAKMMEERP